MSSVFALRLCLDLLAGGLLMFGLSYWWLGDVAHEAAGVAMFALLIAHNAFNRRWYGRNARMRHSPASLFNVVMTAILLLSVALLFVTSAMLATILPEWVSPNVAGIARQIHVLAAYWVFVLVAVHLGLRWPVLMGISRRLFRIDRPSRMRTVSLRLVAGAIAILGLWSFSELKFGARLTNHMSLEWWNFDESVLGFFAHCATVSGLVIAIGHYTTLLLRRTTNPPDNNLPGRDRTLEQQAGGSHLARSDA